MKCPNCKYDPSEEEGFKSGGGINVSYSIADGSQIEEWRCSLCNALINQREESINL